MVFFFHFSAHFTGRNLLQQQSNQTGEDRQNGTYEPLVARNRIDPLNHFKRYKGGYDIKSKHYWGGNYHLYTALRFQLPCWIIYTAYRLPFKLMCYTKEPLYGSSCMIAVNYFHWHIWICYCSYMDLCWSGLWNFPNNQLFLLQ